MSLMDRALDRAFVGVFDRALGLAIARAAAPGTIRYTERQLYYELCRVLRPLHAAPRRPGFTVRPPVRYERFTAALDRRDPPPGLLVAGTAPRRNPDPPAELFDYGFPRLLVCQDAAIAAMLLANELHMESACPVFHLADLPPDPRLTRALRAGGATVHVLHDASAAGLAAVARVRQVFAEEGLRVNALGLRPAHAVALHLTAVRRPPGNAADPADPADLLAWERRWLRSGRVAEVASVNPARLLRTVHRLVRGQSRLRSRPSLRELRAAGFMTWPEVTP
jgi:hypothetical protein